MSFRMNHIHIKATDPRRTANWYVDNFGAKIVGEASPTGALTVRLDLQGVRINVTEPPKGEKLPLGSAQPHMGLEHFGIETDDLAEVMDTLKRKGVKVLEAPRALPSGLKIAFVEAPDNVRLEVMEVPKE